MTIAFFLLFSWLMVTARTRRQVVALTLVGTIAATLIAPPPAQAQGTLVGAIQAVLNVINGAIQTALDSLNAVRGAVRAFYQSVIWPVNLINQARAQVTQMIGQYRQRMRDIFESDVGSATLAATGQLEAVMRNKQTSDFNAVTAYFRNAFGPIPAATAASPEDRAMTDMDDALALGSLKTLKASDAAVDLILDAADQLEDVASEAAPGSAPFLTAAAVVASIQSQALTQKMLAAELRQEAARLAHGNAERKRLATNTNRLGDQIINLLKRN